MKNWLRYAMLTLLMLFAFSAVAEEAQSIVYFNDGSMVMIPASIASDPAKLADYCNTYFPGRGYSFDESAGDYDALLSEVWTSAQYGEGSRAVGVQVETIGILESTVTLSGQTLTVPTKYLTFGGNENASHRIGVVYAPRSGEASLRDTEGGSTIDKAKTGRIVAVLEYDGGTYTKILYDGVEGYIRTDCLLFFSGAETTLGSGTIHIKGATDGAKTVTLRATASSSQAKVTALSTGVIVTVHEKDGDWYAVEADGWYGYVQDEYLNMNE